MQVIGPAEQTRFVHEGGDLWFRRLLDKLPAAAYTTDADGLIAYFNERAVDLWGRAPKLNDRVDRFCGSFRLFAADGTPIPHEECWMARALQDDKEYNGHEIIIERPDGGRRTVLAHASPFHDEAGELLGAVNVLMDVTEAKWAQEALRESEEQFRCMAENVPSMIWTADAEGTITYANQQWLNYTGLTAEQNSRQWPQLVLHPDDYERCIQEWSRALREGCEYEVEVRNRRHDGVYRWFVTRAVPLKDPSGRVASWFGVTTDIHDQKMMQEQLREADRRKDEFLAMLAHELRNPLAPIRSGLEIMSLDPAGHQATIELMQEQTEHLVRLVDDLLDISRIVRGRVELQREYIQLSAVVDRAVAAVRLSVEGRQQQLEVSLPRETLWLHADPVRLVQVVENLLNNASKYTDRGGRIELTVQPDAAERVSRLPSAGGRPASQRGEVDIIVRDNGIGIEEELLPRVFDLFTQSIRSLDRSQGGLGIGLTLVRNLVEMHGGSVSAASEGAGQGSEFTVRLPVAEAPPAHDQPADETATAAARRILIVDDNVCAARMLALWLSRLNSHQIETAHDGPSALEAVAEFRPDVVLLDIGLPGMDGYEVARAIRQNRDLDDTLIAALTGYGQQEDRRRSEEAGIDEHLVKPPAREEIQRLLVHPKLKGRRKTALALTEVGAAKSIERPPLPSGQPNGAQTRSPEKNREVWDQSLHELGNLAHAVALAAQILEQPNGESDTEMVRKMLDDISTSMRPLLASMRGG